MNSDSLLSDLERLKAALPPLPEPAAQPCLIVISGLPGTGKSYFSRKLAERLPVVVLESDSLRKTLHAEPTYSAEESAYLFQICYRLIEELLKKGLPVLLDATNLREYHRERIYHIAERLQAKLILVRVEAPPEVVRQRLQERREKKPAENYSDADWEVYQRMKLSMERMRRQHFAVNTSRDIGPVIDKIVREAQR